MIKKIDGYTIYVDDKNCLGRGSYGTVHVGVSEKNTDKLKVGQKVAVKILAKSLIDVDEYLKNALFGEIKIMESISCENIVGFYDVMESSKNYYIVQELCNGGDLYKMIKGGKCIPEDQAVQYLRQIANGFLAMVREGIIHRDLKPANIMIHDGVMKVGDFGFAKKTSEASKIKSQTIVGSPMYMSLEVLKSQNYSSKCDIWALGFMFFEMIHGYTPWTGNTQFQLINNIEKKKLEIDPKFSANTKDFLKRTLQIRQQNRISWDELFVHPIFNRYFEKKNHGKEQFEDKLKMVMGALRLKINSKNIDLTRTFQLQGYNNSSNQLDKQNFYQFLCMVDPKISHEVSDYVFKQADTNQNGSISIEEILALMNCYNINSTSVNNAIPGLSGKTESEQFKKPKLDAEAKIKKCFDKLMRDLLSQNLTLYDKFCRFNKNKTKGMSYADFSLMMKSITNDLVDEEVRAGFDLIDSDKSNSVEFSELSYYYNRVNGLPSNEEYIDSNNSMEQEKPEYRPGQYQNMSQPGNYAPYQPGPYQNYPNFYHRHSQNSYMPNPNAPNFYQNHYNMGYNQPPNMFANGFNGSQSADLGNKNPFGMLMTPPPQPQNAQKPKSNSFFDLFRN